MMRRPVDMFNKASGLELHAQYINVNELLAHHSNAHVGPRTSTFKCD